MARGRRKGRPIHGWLCIDKGEGLTSTEVVERVKRLTQAAKVGHGGTLDPLATGVLPVALGEATKTVQYVVDGTKHYRFTARFGEARDTDDRDGEVIASSSHRPETAAIETLLPEFEGVIEQVPPRYAAIKIQGERAYDLARRGEVVELEPREVEVDRLTLLARPDLDHAEFELVCGRGVYVRAIVRDIGDKLGCHAHVEALRRLRVGPLLAEHAISLDALERLVADDSLPQALIPVGTALEELPSLALTGPQADRIRAGQTVRVAPNLVVGDGGEEGPVRAMVAGRVVALARLEGCELSPVRVFNL